MAKLKSSKHKGVTVTFHDQGHGLILAKASSITKQFIGSGKTRNRLLTQQKELSINLKNKLFVPIFIHLTNES